MSLHDSLRLSECSLLFQRQPTGALLSHDTILAFIISKSTQDKARAIDLLQRPELLGLNHIALDVTENMQQLSCNSLQEWMQQLNEKSLQLFNKTLRVAVQPQQMMIGSAVYELAFIYDADGALLELISKQEELPQAVGDGWEPWDGEGFIGV